ncbi:uncharacterized protein LDX57_000942 [Aspergillus melleus]|uniref:uncharacterized protein n=1 Tax=Aspergillus melleus TaxID=138277 RepID=UPI001E8CAE20|nr:uncharacterized protein LDX57_000942 [Aspergillus melleus]KAH8423188.1 hypothetical protein LDX57_000942 [Aspergillus melleus]
MLLSHKSDPEDNVQAIRLHPSRDSSTPYSPTNPAPTSALTLDTNIPILQPSKPDEILVRVKATTVVRDALTWPETYAHEYAIPGHDLAGTVATVYSDSNSPFKPGDEVFGMTHADRGSAWADYVLVKASEIALKLAKLSWEEAAAVPLSAQTAYEALFVHAGVPLPSSSASAPVSESNDAPNTPTKSQSQTILFTGAAGGVAGLHVVAASSSNARNASFLRDLGAHKTLEYADLLRAGRDRINTDTATETDTETTYDIIIDTVGGDVLVGC